MVVQRTRIHFCSNKKEPPSDMYSTFEGIRPHLVGLGRIGYIKLISNTGTPVIRNLHNVYRVLIWIIVLLYNFQHIIRAYQVRHSTDLLVDTLFILLTTLNTLGKQLAFNLRGRRIDNIVAAVNDEVFAPKNVYHEKLVKKNAITMSRVLKLYHLAVLFCGMLWTIYPIVNRASGETVNLTGYVPFDTSGSPSFVVVVIFMGIVITIQAFGNVTMDCTIVALYTQAQTQFKLIRYDVEHIVDGEGYKYNYKDELFRKTVHSNFVSCMKHYKRTVWFFKEIESIFSEAMMVQFLVMVWVICMTLYKIVGLKLFSAEYISMVMYLGCMLAQLFIYCYYGTQLKCESELLYDSLYNVEWLKLSPDFRRHLLIFMERCKKPIEPRTAYIIPHSLNTYLTVLRSSYALFTFLDKKS